MRKMNIKMEKPVDKQVERKILNSLDKKRKSNKRKKRELNGYE